VCLERGLLSLVSTIEELLGRNSSGFALSAKSVPTFADRGCCVVSTTDPCGHIFGFLDRNDRKEPTVIFPCVIIASVV
jgi:hypothetical protein